MGGNLVKIAVDTSAVAPMAAWLREKARGDADEARLREILALPPIGSSWRATARPGCPHAA